MLRQDGTRVWVTLSLSEMLQCGNVGIVRHYEAEQANRQTDKKFETTQKSLIGAHVEGVMGEMVVAKARGKYFMPTVNNFKEADLGANVQVRLRMYHHWDLIIRDNDNPDHIYVLVTGTGPEFCVRGWCHAKDVMLPEYRKDYGGSGEAWFVPEKALRPFKIKA